MTGFTSKRVCFLQLILINIAGYLVVGNKDIPICHKLWKALGQDMEDWQKECLDGNVEKHSIGCQVRKQYFEERRQIYKKMCFYEGRIFSTNKYIIFSTNISDVVCLRYKYLNSLF